MHKVAHLLIFLALASASWAQPYLGITWTQNTTITAARLNNLETGIQAASGNVCANLTVDGLTTANHITVKADMLGGTNGVTKTVVSSVNVTLAPSAGSIALLSQDTGFSPATNVVYPGYIIWKEDGTKSGVVSQSWTAPNLTNGAFAGYIFYRLVTAFKNKASGSWSIRQYWQHGGRAKVIPLLSDQIAGGSSNASNQTQSLAGFAPPITVASTVDIFMYVILTSSTNGGSSIFQTFWDSGFTNVSATLQNRAVGSTPTELGEEFHDIYHDGNLYYSYTAPGGTSSLSWNVYLTGFTIDSLGR
jgi:hypothetical protein